MKLSYYPHPIQPIHPEDLPTITAFYKGLLEHRQEKRFGEIEKLINLNSPDFHDVWTNIHGRDLMFTLTWDGVFRCWCRPCGFSVWAGHFDAGGDHARLFEVKCDNYDLIRSWAEENFVGKMNTWTCIGDRNINILWMGICNHASLKAMGISR